MPPDSPFLLELSRTSYVPHLDLLVVYDGLGERELAIDALQKACENRDTDVIFIKVWSQFDKFRDDRRFQEVERRVGFRP